jgi:hypothetical protein
VKMQRIKGNNKFEKSGAGLEDCIHLVFGTIF